MANLEETLSFLFRFNRKTVFESEEGWAIISISHFLDNLILLAENFNC